MMFVCACGREFLKPRSLGLHSRTCEESTPDKLFWAKVDKGPHPKGCWLYMGYRQRFGHGWLGGPGLAHRYAWELLNRTVPKDKCLLHHCDTPACVNPDHLYIGDRTTNNADKIARGRGACGERTRRNVLTESQVREILSNPPRFGNNEERHHEVAECASRYGVAYGVIYALVRGRTWRHISLSMNNGARSAAHERDK